MYRKKSYTGPKVLQKKKKKKLPDQASGVLCSFDLFTRLLYFLLKNLRTLYQLFQFWTIYLRAPVIAGQDLITCGWYILYTEGILIIFILTTTVIVLIEFQFFQFFYSNTLYPQTSEQIVLKNACLYDLKSTKKKKRILEMFKNVKLYKINKLTL